MPMGAYSGEYATGLFPRLEPRVPLHDAEQSLGTRLVGYKREWVAFAGSLVVTGE